MFLLDASRHVEFQEPVNSCALRTTAESSMKSVIESRCLCKGGDHPTMGVEACPHIYTALPF